jgi:hypothetical protein
VAREGRGQPLRPGLDAVGRGEWIMEMVLTSAKPLAA